MLLLKNVRSFDFLFCFVLELGIREEDRHLGVEDG
jgi:hypothetical protein